MAAAWVEEAAAMADQRRQERLFIDLQKDASSFAHLWAPKVFPEYGGERVLVLERRSGPTVEELGSMEGVPHRSARLVRVVCSTWLTQAVMGSVVPVAFGGQDLQFTHEGRVGFVAGLLAERSPEDQEWLWSYLVAVARGDPDESCRCLLLRMTKRRAAHRARRELLIAFRQENPVSAECVYPDRATLIDVIRAQARLAAAAGFVPQPPVTRLCRGLDSLDGMIRALPSDGDPFREAIEMVWSMRLGATVRRLFGAERLTRSGHEYAGSLLEMPEVMESMVSDFEQPAGLPPWEATRPANSRGGRLALLLLICASVGLAVFNTAAPSKGIRDRVNWAGACLICLCAARAIRA
jgi:hypothetical protein